MTIDQVSEIFISRVPGETTLAHMINGEVSGFVVDRECDKTLLGNIYLGKVTKVVAGINSAFIDIGQDKAGYLNANDAQFKNCRRRKPKLIIQGE